MKTWLLTGTSRGLGRAMAEAALRRGDQVVATARDISSLRDLEREHGDRVMVHAFDVTDASGAQGAVQAAYERFGTLDVVVSNAAFANHSAIEDTTEEDFRAHWETNFFGMVRVVKAALPRLRAQRHGHLIQIGSISGRVGGTAGMSAYCSTKYAIEGFSEVLRAEAVPLGLKVTIVEPGAFRTDFVASAVHVAPSAAYEQSVGARQESRQAHYKEFPGDPVLAGERVVDLAWMDEPPFRVLLGSDAVARSREDGLARLAEIDTWDEFSSSTDVVAQTSSSDQSQNTA